MAFALASKYSLPQYVVFRSNTNNKYCGYVHDNGKSDGYLAFSETQAVSPYAKFEVEVADVGGKDGLIHIRSCQNNKYWERTQNLSITGNSAQQYWITATASKPEEDQSKESCTLFKPISVDSAMNTVRIKHVQSGCYLYLWPSNVSGFTQCVLANYKVTDSSSRDLFTIVDWESLLILPRYVTFKGDNDNYLCYRQLKGYPYLQFATGDIGDSTAIMEIFSSDDGNIRIKSLATDKFWRRDPDWIKPDSSDTSSNNKETLFRPFQVNDETIGLLSLGNNKFCKRLTTDGKTSCLNAAVSSITEHAQLRVEEPVMQRKIYNIKYDLDNARIYDERVLLVSRNSDANRTQQATTLGVTLTYVDTRTKTFRNNFSLTLGAKVSVDVGIPLIFDGAVELSSEYVSEIEWGKTEASSDSIQIVHNVVTPPMTKVTVNLISTYGKCDVPFTYTQRDLLYNGTTVITEVVGGTYTGSNYFSNYFETKEEPLIS